MEDEVPAPMVGVEAAAAAAEAAAGAAGLVCVDADDDKKRKTTKSPRRQCRFPGCTKTIKSQGHCQKHGASVRKCKVDGCQKQAQGTHDGMCKKHWNEVNKPPPPVQPEKIPPHPQGQSVYDQIIPASVAWKAVKKRTVTGTHVTAAEAAAAVGAEHLPALPGAEPEAQPGIVSVTAGPAIAEVVEPMPIVSHLKTNANLPSGWHRQQERLARGMHPPPKKTTQLESWERQLVVFEALLISGLEDPPLKELAHAWGREKGFHVVVSNQVCGRRGVIERKRRSDVGKKMSAEQKTNFKQKLNAGRASKKAKTEVASQVAAEVMDGDGAIEELPPADVDAAHAAV